MVRINLINPNMLTDEHLVAEYVEIQMLVKFMCKYPFGDVTNKYTLGKGHMNFFRDKPQFIYTRFLDVVNEINKRKINYNLDNVNEYLNLLHNLMNFNDTKYDPDTLSKEINTKRVVERLLNPLRKKNNWHYYGKPIKCIKQFINKINLLRC